jgi:hypothetical protein
MKPGANGVQQTPGTYFSEMSRALPGKLEGLFL